MGDDEKEDEVELHLNPDVYDAVVAAAFGGVQVSLPLEDDKNHKAGAPAPFIRIHPAAAFGIACILFMVQVSCLTCLMLDIDFEANWATGSWEEFDKTPGRRILLCSKILMVCVLQVICLKEFLSGMRPLLFVCNPFTWYEIYRPSAKAFPKLFHPALCVPFCIAAEAMQFVIAYMVAVLSMTVILKAEKVSEVVFNGLVITFLTDLDEYTWQACVPIFHLDGRKYNKFKFSLKKGYKKFFEQERRERTSKSKAEFDWKVWLRRGRGGKVQILENVLIFAFLAVLFFRQTFIFTQAIDSGVLPLKRDVCSLYRGLEGKDKSGLMALKAFDFLTLVDYRKSIHNCIKRFNVTDCDEEHMKPFCMSLVPGYFKTYPKYLTTACFGLVMTFVFPQVLYANSQRIRKALLPEGVMETETKDQEEQLMGGAE